jgi:hypothetical protein
MHRFTKRAICVVRLKEELFETCIVLVGWECFKKWQGDLDLLTLYFTHQKRHLFTVRVGCIGAMQFK